MKAKEDEMTIRALSEEPSKTKTQQLQGWLRANQEEAADDIRILSEILRYQRSHPGHGYDKDGVQVYGNVLSAFACCCNMVSEDRKEAIMKNEKKLRRITERLAALRLVEEFSFQESIEELSRVFGAPCELDFTNGKYGVPPLVKWSPDVWNLKGKIRIEFVLVLSKRILIVRHIILKEGNATGFSEMQFPHLLRVGICKWSETIEFVFEHNGERSYLNFDKETGEKGWCFLRSRLA